MPEEKKQCPYCSEEILASAKKCKHCGEFLDKETKIKEQKSKEEKTKKCAKCKSDIPASATKCPKCQADLRSWFARHKIISIFLIFIGIGVIMSVLDPEDNMMKDDVALVCAQNQIKSMLKSPGTAKYPWDIKAIYDKSTNTYLVGSYVDSQNSFGGTVRSEFVCEMTVKDPKNFICETDCKIK